MTKSGPPWASDVQFFESLFLVSVLKWLCLIIGTLIEVLHLDICRFSV